MQKKVLVLFAIYQRSHIFVRALRQQQQACYFIAAIFSSSARCSDKGCHRWLIQVSVYSKQNHQMINQINQTMTFSVRSLILFCIIVIANSYPIRTNKNDFKNPFLSCYFLITYRIACKNLGENLHLRVLKYFFFDFFLSLSFCCLLVYII